MTYEIRMISKNAAGYCQELCLQLKGDEEKV